MQDKIFKILFDKDEITWRSIIYELVKSEQMDVWDIDISLLTRQYIEMIKKLKELDFRVSGKVLLAAAILLKIKSDRLVGEDILQFDRLFEPEGVEEDLFEEPINLDPDRKIDKVSLIPKTPQPRKRKVSIYDLMEALEKALEVKRRRVMRNIPPVMEVPRKTRDITEIIKEIYGKIKTFFLQKRGKALTFSNLIPSNKREDKIYTFMPLLHLSNQQKISLQQQKHFGEIEILLRSKHEVDKELVVNSNN